MIKEKRIVKIQFQRAGAGNINARISLPIKWIRDSLKLNESEREISISLTEDDKIIIEKYKGGRKNAMSKMWK